MIKNNVKNIPSEIPKFVELEAAAKTRTSEDIMEVIEAGVTIIGENYIKDIRTVYPKIG